MGGLGCDNMTAILVCFLHEKSYEDLAERCSRIPQTTQSENNETTNDGASSTIDTNETNSSETSSDDDTKQESVSDVSTITTSENVSNGDVKEQNTSSEDKSNQGMDIG